MYIGDYLGRRQIYSPDKLAIIDVGKQPALELTYRQMNERANRLANWLRDVAGVQKGRPGGDPGARRRGAPGSFYACGKLGAIHTPFNWRLHWRELAGLIELTRPKALVFSDDFKEAVAQITNCQLGIGNCQLSMAEPHSGKSLTIDNSQFPIDNFLHLDGAGLPVSLPYQSTLDQSPNLPSHLRVSGSRRHRLSPLHRRHHWAAQGRDDQPSHDLLERDEHGDPRSDPRRRVRQRLPAVSCRRAVHLSLVAGDLRQHHDSDPPVRPGPGAGPDRALPGDGLRGRAHHVPDDDHGGELGNGRSEQPALLHQRRRAFARAVGREVHARERASASSRASA